MTDTTKRFDKGVHSPTKCANNRTGYAAISSAAASTDLHSLKNLPFNSSVKSSPKEKKRPFLGCDALAYTLMKSVCKSPPRSEYIILLSANITISNTVSRMVSSMASNMDIVTIVKQESDSYHIDSSFARYTSSCKMETFDDLQKFIASIHHSENVSLIIHPTVTECYIKLSRIINASSWFVPSRKSQAYVSTAGEGYFCHNVFPWSTSFLCLGFTVGSGEIVGSSQEELQEYLGLFYLYENMVSATPLRNSCTDCECLKSVGKKISLLIGENTRESKHNHRHSLSSIEALEEIQERLNKALQQI